MRKPSAPNQYFSQKEHCQEKEFEFDVNYFLNVWVTKNLTIMVRKDAIDRDYHKKFKYARDVHFIYYVMQKGNGVCHAFNGGVYRKNVKKGTNGTVPNGTVPNGTFSFGYTKIKC